VCNDSKTAASLKVAKGHGKSFHGREVMKTVRTALSSATPFFRLIHRGFDGLCGYRVGGTKTRKDFVGCVLQTRIRLMKLARGLTGQLTKLIAVGHMRECPKNQVGTHYSISFVWPARTELRGTAGASKRQTDNGALHETLLYRRINDAYGS
jgi:hypothetical protein